MIRNFSPESTNPRERRAFVHAMRDKAIKSGLPQDKIAAIEAANRASHGTKGAGLAKEVVQAMVNVSFISTADRPIGAKEETWDGRASYFISERDVRACKAVGEALGGLFGTTIISPGSPLYESAASDVAREHDLSQASLRSNMSGGYSTIAHDWSQPGTYQLCDVVRLVGRDTHKHREIIEANRLTTLPSVSAVV